MVFVVELLRAVEAGENLGLMVVVTPKMRPRTQIPTTKMPKTLSLT